ncbi:MAG: bifunctional diaminohydroxyphosphoribosylaminopyrimidine deaminase/5-amino-6-(5-phosphoribosylamino)uracil reductase RibD [Betaproteobacteria bacterium]
MFTDLDHEFMAIALEQAKLARWISQPNPRVGCVIVSNGKIIGKGFTQIPGQAHAEIEALRDAQLGEKDVTGSTVYVTLEPCCHSGRTPPCTTALIKAKVSRVIIAAPDPNPLVAGQGVKLLEEAGIEVKSGLLARESVAINPGFFKRMLSGMPWVRLKIASSIDGITALPNGQSQWITGPIARQDGHLWRAQAGAILTGAGTVKEDNPQLTVRNVDSPHQPLRVIVDSHLETPLQSHILTNGRTLIVCARPEEKHLQSIKKSLTSMGVELLQLPNLQGKVDLSALLKHLATSYEINEIHVEAGFKLNGSLIREDLVDELLIYQAPTLLGTGAGISNLGPLHSLGDRFDWQLVEHTSLGEDLRLRFLRKI